MTENSLIKVKQGRYAGMSARVLEVTADSVRARLCSTGQIVRLPRHQGRYVVISEEPMTTAEFRRRDGVAV